LDENLSESDDAAIRSVYFKFGFAHFGWFIFLLPGPNCVFPRICLRHWGVKLVTQRSWRKSAVLFAQFAIIFFRKMGFILSDLFFDIYFLWFHQFLNGPFGLKFLGMSQIKYFFRYIWRARCKKLFHLEKKFFCLRLTS